MCVLTYRFAKLLNYTMWITKLYEWMCLHNSDIPRQKQAQYIKAYPSKLYPFVLFSSKES